MHSITAGISRFTYVLTTVVEYLLERVNGLSMITDAMAPSPVDVAVSNLISDFLAQRHKPAQGKSSTNLNVSTATWYLHSATSVT